MRTDLRIVCVDPGAHTGYIVVERLVQGDDTWQVLSWGTLHMRRGGEEVKRISDLTRRLREVARNYIRRSRRTRNLAFIERPRLIDRRRAVSIVKLAILVGWTARSLEEEGWEIHWVDPAWKSRRESLFNGYGRNDTTVHRLLQSKISDHLRDAIGIWLYVRKNLQRYV